MMSTTFCRHLVFISPVKFDQNIWIRFLDIESSKTVQIVVSKGFYPFLLQSSSAEPLSSCEKVGSYLTVHHEIAIELVINQSSRMVVSWYGWLQTKKSSCLGPLSCRVACCRVVSCHICVN